MLHFIQLLEHLKTVSILQVYTYEKADGVGRSVDLVLQGFIRFSALSVLPAIISASVLYLMVSTL